MGRHQELAERILSAFFKDVGVMLEEILEHALPREEVRQDVLEGRDKLCADCLAAAVDVEVRAGRLDARSLIADARLCYGEPFEPVEAERMARGVGSRHESKVDPADNIPKLTGRPSAPWFGEALAEGDTVARADYEGFLSEMKAAGLIGDYKMTGPDTALVRLKQPLRHVKIKGWVQE